MFLTPKAQHQYWAVGILWTKHKFHQCLIMKQQKKNTYRSAKKQKTHSQKPQALRISVSISPGQTLGSRSFASSSGRKKKRGKGGAKHTSKRSTKSGNFSSSYRKKKPSYKPQRSAQAQRAINAWKLEKWKRQFSQYDRETRGIKRPAEAMETVAFEDDDEL